jgi:nucleoside-diphosphate-sugar epimerase
MTSRNVIVFGGSGFIGTRLCMRFFNSKNVSFQIIDKVKSRFFSNNSLIADIRLPLDDNLIDSKSILINLAAEHRDDITPKSLYYDVNVTGAINVCNVARIKNISTIVFTSSVAVYGFAPIGTDESGYIAPFNDYGRTKFLAENVYKDWQSEDPVKRTLVILRPTVVFGEGNRGNVYNLLRQIASGKFLMVGDGLNRKSMAYVENVAAFLEYSLDFKPGLHVFNYIDKPDFSMNSLISHVNRFLGRPGVIKYRLPFPLAFFLGSCFDLISKVTGKKFPISAIRVKKFCVNSVYESAIESTGFIPPLPLIQAIERTVRFEFIDDNKSEQVFYSE